MLVYKLNENGLCENCDPESNKRARLAKQREVVQYIKLNSCHVPVAVDKIPVELKACGDRERPDIPFDGGDRIVIVEVDEYQHVDRNCDTVRMYNVAQSYGMEKCIWIRYNPDNFKKIKGDSTRWSNTSKLKLLVEWLNWCLTCPIDKFNDHVSVIHLFYNGFVKSDVPIKSVVYNTDTQTVEIVSSI